MGSEILPALMSVTSVWRYRCIFADDASKSPTREFRRFWRIGPDAKAASGLLQVFREDQNHEREADPFSIKLFAHETRLLDNIDRPCA